MENPSQASYTTEQLFSLVPIAPVKPQPAIKALGGHTAVASAIEIPNFWNKHKWPIIVCGIFIIGATCYYFCCKSQKEKEANNAH